MKLVIISSGNPSDMKGVMNFVQQEAKSIMASERDLSIEVYLKRRYYSSFFKFVKTRKFHLPSRELCASLTIDGILYHQIWQKYGVWDVLIINKLCKRLISRRLVKKFEKQVGDCDAVISHNTECHIIANHLAKQRAIKHICIWHGSDINIDPFQNKMMMTATIEALQSADMNLFVSKALMKRAKDICITSNVDVLYTGPSHFFMPYTEKEIGVLKRQYGISGDVILGFVGNIIDVKNVLVLPEIVLNVKKMLPDKDVRLVIVGNGDLETTLFNLLEEYNTNYIYLGKQPPVAIPGIMNCLDILVLPSKNEGLPMVTLEAMACGVKVVGSNVGGISESIGKENCFELGPSFVKDISVRIVKLVKSQNNPIALPSEFSWTSAIDKLYGYLT